MNKTDKTNLTDQTKYRLNEISKTENYFHQEINQRISWSKKLSKPVAAYDYRDKALMSVSVVGAPIGIAGASFALIYSLTTGIIKKLLSITRNTKKKHGKILMLAKVK